MGYTRSFNKSIHVSGSVTASYPASEHGGSHSVYYEQTVPVTINIHVDTDPFDERIHGACSSVNLLTGAVATMNTVQCKSIFDNSKRISERLVDGFYQLIHSDLSVKKSEAYQDIQTKFGLLMAHSNDLQGKYERMNDDMARLQNHYAEIFHGIDQDLQKRIKELDRSAFVFADTVRPQIIEAPFKQEAALGIGQFGELKQSVELITLAHMRKRLSNIISRISDSMENTVRYAKNVQASLYEETCGTMEQECVPVLYLQTKEETPSEMQLFVSNCDKKEVILSQVGSYLEKKDESAWKTVSETEWKAIDQEFSVMLENHVKTDSEQKYQERVYKEMMRMWKANQKELKNI